MLLTPVLLRLGRGGTGGRLVMVKFKDQEGREAEVNLDVAHLP
jgi:hypothetical protein